MRLFLPLMLALMIPTGASAHAGHVGAGWANEPWTLVPLLLAGATYAAGAVRLRARSGGRGLSWMRSVSFAVGWMLAAFLLLSPLDGWSEQFLSAHMVQHFALMLLAAPLMVLGRISLAFLWALPRAWRRGIGGWQRGRIHAALAWMIHPAGALLIYALTLWLWHAPPLYQAALRHDAVHALQHLCFVGAAALFWQAVIERPRAESRIGAFLAIFAAAVQSCMLAALMTLSTVHWYPRHKDGPFGLSALEDQQLGGLIMWVPCCVVMIFAGIMVFARLLRDSEQRQRRRAA
jgi:putative membrane protein